MKQTQTYTVRAHRTETLADALEFLRPLPPTEVEVRPELTADLRAFWVEELRELMPHHQAALLVCLTQRYGKAAAWEIEKAVGA